MDHGPLCFAHSRYLFRFTWLVASFVLAARWRGISDMRTRDIATAAALAYRTQVAMAAEENTLDTWYAAVTCQGILRGVKGDVAVSRHLKKIDAEARHHTSEYVFHKLTTEKDGQVRLLDQPPLVYHAPGVDISAVAALFFENYVRTLRWSHQMLFGRLRFVDAAIKVVGIGRVGTRCYVVLMMGEQNEPVLLQIKEARNSVLAGPAGPSPWGDEGERVVVGQRLLQTASDIFLGWTRGPQGRHYYVRQLRDMKASVDIASSNAHELTFMQACAAKHLLVPMPRPAVPPVLPEILARRIRSTPRLGNAPWHMSTG